MKTHAIQNNATYQIKIGRNLVPVMVTGPNPDGGVYGVLVKSGKGITIKDTGRLIPLDGDDATTPEAKKDKPETKRPKLYTVEHEIDETTPTAASPDKKPAKVMTLLDAAAHLLSLGTGDPMRCKDIVDLAIARGLWSPGEGKTPANTLYAAILREIREKGPESRFIKIARGRFAHKDSDFVKHERARLHQAYS
jgi:hypothetical protein